MPSIPNRFQATFKDRSIWEIRVPLSGLSYAPPLEWGLTAQWWHCAWEAFELLDGDTQSFMVAVYRAKQRIDAVLAKDQAEQQKRADRRRSK